MHSKTLFLNMLFIFLHTMCNASESKIEEALQISREEWGRNRGCCSPSPPEDFKNCVDQKRRSLPVSSLGFKSISCQCHVTPFITGVTTRTERVQTFRQCLLTDIVYEEITEKPIGHLDVFEAIFNGDLNAVKNIVYNHPDRVVKDKNERTPIMAAVRSEMFVFNFLVCHSSNLEELDMYGNNILHHACMNGSVDIVRRLISFRMFDLDSIGEYGRTAVQMAVRHGHIDVAEFLIQAGCNVTALDKWGNNILHLACKSKNITTLLWIMAKGIFSLDSSDFFGHTPLLVAALNGFPTGCECLIDHGADEDAVNIRGENWLQLLFQMK